MHQRVEFEFSTKVGGSHLTRANLQPTTKINLENRKSLPFSSSLWSGRRYHLLGEQPIVSVDHGAAHSTFLFQTNTQLLLWKHVSFTKVKLKLERFSFPGSSIPNNCHLYRPHDRPWLTPLLTPPQGWIIDWSCYRTSDQLHDRLHDQPHNRPHYRPHDQHFDWPRLLLSSRFCTLQVLYMIGSASLSSEANIKQNFVRKLKV